MTAVEELKTGIMVILATIVLVQSMVLGISSGVGQELQHRLGLAEGALAELKAKKTPKTITDED